MRILATIAALLFTVQWAAAQNAKVIEAEVIAELNFARTEPQRYATERLEPLLKRFESDKLSYVNSEGDRMMTSEGVDAVVEAIAEMKKATPCGKLTANPNLTKMAQAFATDLGKNGITGHVDSRGNGMNARFVEAGYSNNWTSECLDFGNRNAIDIVLSLIVDDGVQSRGHRKVIMTPKYTDVGVGFATHIEYDFCAVIDFLR